MYEPVFCPRPDSDQEDDGVVITPLLSLSKINLVELLVLDAKSFKEVARVRYSALGPVTPTLHGLFDPSRKNTVN